jgi:hypothetical protein
MPEGQLRHKTESKPEEPEIIITETGMRHRLNDAVKSGSVTCQQHHPENT